MNNLPNKLDLKTSLVAESFKTFFSQNISAMMILIFNN